MGVDENPEIRDVPQELLPIHGKHGVREQGKYNCARKKKGCLQPFVHLFWSDAENFDVCIYPAQV